MNTLSHTLATNRFTVETPIVSLAVATANGAVTRIDLNERGSRTAEAPFEKQVAQELQEYFAGARTEFTFPTAPGGTAFDQRVWRALGKIPYGGTATYGEIASAVDNPNAARAVGAANGRNPIPIVVPCHRVVAAGGKLGGYGGGGGGLDLKRRLLNLEAGQRTLTPDP